MTAAFRISYIVSNNVRKNEAEITTSYSESNRKVNEYKYNNVKLVKLF